MVLPVVQFNAHKKGKKGLTVFYNCKLHNFVSGSRVYTCIQITLYYFINQLWPAFAKQKAREVSLIIVYIGVCLLCAEPSVPLEAKGQMFFFFSVFGAIMTLRQCAEEFCLFRFQDLCYQMMSGVFSYVQPVCRKIFNRNAGHDMQLWIHFRIVIQKLREYFSLRGGSVNLPLGLSGMYIHPPDNPKPG